MKTFVDNVAVFAVESCLLSDLSGVFSPSSALQMDQQTICQIASESQSDHLLREQNQKRRLVLEVGLDICNAHVERRQLSNLLLSMNRGKQPLTFTKIAKGQQSPAIRTRRYQVNRQ